MKNLINFDDCATTDNYNYFFDYMRNNGKYGICFYKKDTKRKMLECYCPTNREYFEMPYRPGVNSKGMTCPNESSCDCVCKFYNAKRSLAGLNRSGLYGRIEKYKDGIVLKLYDVKVDFSAEAVSGNDDEDPVYPLERDGDIEVTEAERIFYRNNGKVQVFTRLRSIYNPYSGYTMGIGTEFRRTARFPKFSFYYPGDIASDLKGTYFEKASACVSEIRQIIYDEHMYESLDVLFGYITKEPSLVKLYKAGFKTVVADYIHLKTIYGNLRVVGEHGLHFRSKTIKKILGVEVSKFDKIDKSTIRLERIGNYICAVKNGAKLLPENEDIICGGYFKDLVSEFFPDKASETIKFLRSVLKREKAVYVNLYYDYLRDMKRLGYDTELPEIKFPPHLKSAHDRAAAEVRERADSLCVKGFYLAVKPYSKWVYSDSDKYISPILTSTELHHWSMKFHNCSGGYVDRIRNGKCVIFLVRLRSEPLIPYYMFEMNTKTGGLIQLYGVGNSNPTEEIEAFVNGFIKKYRGRCVAYA